MHYNLIEKILYLGFETDEYKTFDSDLNKLINDINELRKMKLSSKNEKNDDKIEQS